MTKSASGKINVLSQYKPMLLTYMYMIRCVFQHDGCH